MNNSAKYAINKDLIANLRFLVADDQMMIRTLVSEQLRILGARRIETALNGKEALQILEEGKKSHIHYDIAIIDWGMPIMSGMELLQACKGRFNDTAFVMLTGETEKQNVLLALENGVASYIVKPVSLEILKDRLTRILAKKTNAALKA